MKPLDPKLFSHLWIEDILYFEGPLLALLRDTNTDQKFFYYWSGVIEGLNRWLVIPTTDDQIDVYKKQQTTLLQVVQSSPVVYLAYIDEALATIAVTEYAPSELKPEWLPSDKSLYDEDLAP